MVRVELNDILFIEGLKNYASIYTNTQRIVTLQVMKQLEEILPPNRFVRVHKSFIIALDKINSIERQEIHIKDRIIPYWNYLPGTFLQTTREQEGIKFRTEFVP